MFQNGGKHLASLKEHSVAFGFGAPFLGSPFLKKGSLKLKKVAHLTLIGQFLE